jgi:hypothetical protein
MQIPPLAALQMEQVRREPQVFLYAFEIGNCAQQLAAMSKRCDADLFKVLISQVAQNSEINIVLGKMLGVIGHAELFEPIRYRLRRCLLTTTAHRAAFLPPSDQACRSLQ